MATERIPESRWRWYGIAGHFIGSSRCRFHLCTEIGDVLVSTVGEWSPCGRDALSEIGVGRLYETKVFPKTKTGRRCELPECWCDLPAVNWGQQLDYAGSNTAGDAQRGHMAMCEKWAKKGGDHAD